jgi:hypothetical protein
VAGCWWCLAAACGGLLLGRANTRVSRVLRQTRAHARMDRMPYSTRALVCAVAVWGPVALSSSQDLDDIDIDGGSGSWSGPPKPLPTWSRCEFNSTKGQLPPGDPPKSICPGCNAPDCTCPKGACWPGKNLTHTPDHTCDCFAKLSFCEKGTQPVYTPGEVCPSCWPPENKACMCFAAIDFCEAVPAPAPVSPPSLPPPSRFRFRFDGVCVCVCCRRLLAHAHLRLSMIGRQELPSSRIADPRHSVGRRRQIPRR